MAQTCCLFPQQIIKYFGGRTFKQYSDFRENGRNLVIAHEGAQPLDISSMHTIPRRPHGASLSPPKHFLDRFGLISSMVMAHLSLITIGMAYSLLIRALGFPGSMVLRI